MGNFYSYIDPEKYFVGKTIIEGELEFAPYEDVEPVWGSSTYDGKVRFYMNNGDILIGNVPYPEYQTYGFEDIYNVEVVKVNRHIEIIRWLGFDWDIRTCYILTDKNDSTYELPIYGLVIQ